MGNLESGQEMYETPPAEVKGRYNRKRRGIIPIIPGRELGKMYGFPTLFSAEFMTNKYFLLFKVK